MIAVAALERAAVGGTPDDDVGEPVLVREGDGAAAGLAAAEAEQRENGVVEGLRGGRIGQRLYDARKALAERLELKGIVFGARMPAYARNRRKVKSPEDYLEKVLAGTIRDPTI